MDINLFRALCTLLLFVSFLGLVFWVYHPAKKKGFQAIGDEVIADDLSIDQEQNHE